MDCQKLAQRSGCESIVVIKRIMHYCHNLTHLPNVPNTVSDKLRRKLISAFYIYLLMNKNQRYLNSFTSNSNTKEGKPPFTSSVPWSQTERCWFSSQRLYTWLQIGALGVTIRWTRVHRSYFGCTMARWLVGWHGPIFLQLPPHDTPRDTFISLHQVHKAHVDLMGKKSKH